MGKNKKRAVADDVEEPKRKIPRTADHPPSDTHSSGSDTHSPQNKHNSDLQETKLNSDLQETKLKQNSDLQETKQNSGIQETKENNDLQEANNDIQETKKKIYNENHFKKVQYQAAAMQRPKMFFTPEYYGSDLISFEKPLHKCEAGKALCFKDLQQLFLYALRRGRNCTQTRWCHIIRPGKITSVTLIVLADVTAIDFEEHKERFPFLDGNFPKYLRAGLVNPILDSTTFQADMTGTPLTSMKANGVKDESSSKEDGLESSSENSGDKGADPKTDNNGEKSATTSTDAFDRTKLLLTPSEMSMDQYPKFDSSQTANFVLSKKKYAPVTPNSPMFAVDCEMCLTCAGNELTRVTVVNEDRQVIYDELVKPRNRIIDYVTRYSGITKAMLAPVTKRIEQVQSDITKLLPADAILVGQSLGNDLNALKMCHPFVIDTSVIYNVSGTRAYKCSLKKLSLMFLGRTIQDSSAGHDSAEDALAALDLVKLKLSKGLLYGDAVAAGFSSYFGTSLGHTPTLPKPQPSLPHKQKNSAKTNSTIQKNSLHHAQMSTFSEVLSKYGISARVVGDNLSGPKGMQVMRTACDDDSVFMASELCQSTDFVWVELTEFSSFMTSMTDQETKHWLEKKKRVLMRLDRCVRDIVQALPEKSVVAVVLPGNTKNKEQNAATFLCVT